MTRRPLGTDEVRATGFTHVATIEYTDLSVGATTNTITLVDGLGVGHLVTAAAFYLETGFVGTSITNLTIEVGWDLAAGTDDPNGLIEAAELATAGTEILAGDATGVAFATKRTGFAFQESGDIEALFTATGANLSALTAGKVHVYLTIVDLTKIKGS